MRTPNYTFLQLENYLYSKPVKGLRGCGLGYGFAFNGKERDNETYGEGNAYDYGARIYDPRLGRWLSRDPKEGAYPSWSTYNAFMCNPIYIIDPTGKGGIVSKVLDENGKVIALKVTVSIYIYTDLEKTADEMHQLQQEIKSNMESNWNSVVYTDPETCVKTNKVPMVTKEGFESLPVQFEVNVEIKTRTEIVEMVKNKKLKEGENIVEITDDETSQTRFEGNSGVFNLAQRRLDCNIWAHEFGHILNFINPFFAKKDNTLTYHAFPAEESAMNNNPQIVPLDQRVTTQADVDRLNGVLRDGGKVLSKGLGNDVIGTKAKQAAVGGPANNIIYKGGEETN